MTDKTVQWQANGQPKKMDGWFSWRHKTREAHDAAREHYLTRANDRPRQRWDDDAKRWVKFESAEQRLIRAIFVEVSA